MTLLTAPVGDFMATQLAPVSPRSYQEVTRKSEWAEPPTMEANGIAAATNGAESRSHFDAIVGAMDNPNETAVGAAVAAATGGAAAMSRAWGHDRRIGRGRDGSDAGSGVVRGGVGGVAAAAGASRRPIDVDEIQQQSASPSPAGRDVRGRVDDLGGSAGRSSRGALLSTSMQSGHGVGASGVAAGSNLATRSAVHLQQQHTSLMCAHAMRAADSVQRLLETGAGSTVGVRVGPRATSPLDSLLGRVGDGGPTAPVALPSLQRRLRSICRGKWGRGLSSMRLLSSSVLLSAG